MEGYINIIGKLFVVLLLMVVPAQSHEVAQKIRDSSVIITLPKSLGSGTLFKKNDTVYVITCNHVLIGASKIEYNINISQEITSRGVMTKYYNGWAKIIYQSEECDLAILESMDNTFGQNYIKFLPIDALTPDIGDEVYHVGFMRGKYERSLTKGIISAHNRIMDEKNNHRWDQVDLVHHPGSSGGGIFDKEGNFIGIFTHTHGNGKNYSGLGFFIPIRQIRKWARENKIDIMD